MIDFVVEYASWLACASSLICVWLTGSKVWWAPWVGVGGQVFWYTLAWRVGDTGLFINSIVFTVLGIRNGLLWARQR